MTELEQRVYDIARDPEMGHAALIDTLLDAVRKSIDSAADIHQLRLQVFGLNEAAIAGLEAKLHECETV